MTGPEHYREAEQLAAAVSSRELAAEQVKAQAAVAQVHATLALAAATADSFTLPGLLGDDHKYDDWREATYLVKRGGVTR